MADKGHDETCQVFVWQVEGKLVKARQVKAGMMSELLTGKIRLV